MLLLNQLKRKNGHRDILLTESQAWGSISGLLPYKLDILPNELSRSAYQSSVNEPFHEKTLFVPMQKQRRRAGHNDVYPDQTTKQGKKSPTKVFTDQIANRTQSYLGLRIAFSVSNFHCHYFIQRVLLKMSLVMRKRAFCQCENKDADRLCSICKAG